MKVGFVNCSSPNFKGLFEVKTDKNQSVWVNTDHFVSYMPNEKKYPELHTVKDSITLSKDMNEEKILKLYSLAAGAKDRVINVKECAV